LPASAWVQKTVLASDPVVFLDVELVFNGVHFPSRGVDQAEDVPAGLGWACR
jgi:hypothetical protein